MAPSSLPDKLVSKARIPSPDLPRDHPTPSKPESSTLTWPWPFALGLLPLASCYISISLPLCSICCFAPGEPPQSVPTHLVLCTGSPPLQALCTSTYLHVCAHSHAHTCIIKHPKKSYSLTHTYTPSACRVPHPVFGAELTGMEEMQS